MGIGIYQTREVVRSLGGDIAVESEVGKGTTVRLLLPIARERPEGARRASP